MSTFVTKKLECGCELEVEALNNIITNHNRLKFKQKNHDHTEEDIQEFANTYCTEIQLANNSVVELVSYLMKTKQLGINIS